MAAPADFYDSETQKEGLGEAQDFFTIDISDEELVTTIDRKIQKAYGDYEKLKEEGKTNERYWAQQQLEGINLYWHNSRIVQNRIYLSVETMVPIITSKPAEPIVSIANDEEEESEKSKKLTDKIQKIFLDKYNDVDKPQQEVFEMIARHLLLYKVGIPKIIWDSKTDDFHIEFIHPHKCIISPDGHYNEDVWVAQYLEWTLQEILDEFPEKENDIMANLFPGTAMPENLKGTPVGFWEYWSEDGKYVVWKMQNVILQKKLNPYLIWTKDKEFDRVNNHFDYPKKPIMFLNSQNLGRHVWDDTTPVTQGISIQDGINLMQRIITDTAKDQGILVGAQELIDRDELYKYTGAPNEKLSVKGADPTRALHRVSPKSLENFILDNLLHLENSLDNVMGTHATTRGEKSKQPTLGQDIMSRESDYGRIDAIVRGIERIAAEIYNWEMQIIVAKYKKEHYSRILGNKTGEKMVEEIKTATKQGVKIIVRPGSTLPTDKLSQRQQAIELAKANKISDLDFFKDMDYPNPREMAKNLFLQNNKPEMLYPDLIKQIEADNKKVAKEKGRLDEQGNIIPETSLAAGQMPPPAIPPQMPGAMGGQPVEQPIMPQPQQTLGTEHTEALLQGIPVPPMEGIDPSMAQDHVSRELQFMGSEQFLQLPEEIQANYANHVLQERQMLQGAVEGEVNASPIGATA